MQIIRIDSKKDMHKEIKIIEIEIDDCVYRLSEVFGELCINTPFHKVRITPSCANQVYVGGVE